MTGTAGTAVGTIKPDAGSVLLVIDVQNDFLPGGSLAVADGNEIIPLINTLAGAFESVVLTRDWHPPGHVSFASSHPGKQPFDLIDLPYGQQVLWPDHCILGTTGANIAAGIDIPKAQLILQKGYHPDVDSYSAFLEADKTTQTGLAGYLRERGLSKVYVVGLATDFCVAFSALDARAAGFEVTVIEDACRGIDAGGSLARACAAMDAAGVRRIVSRDIAV